MSRNARPVIAVFGAGDATGELAAVAEEVGRLVAERCAAVMTGGHGGVMEAAARGAFRAGGITLALLPGERAEDANHWIQVPLTTGMGLHRNSLLARSCAGAIAVGGKGGTVAEIAAALNFGKPVATIGSWSLHHADGTPDDRAFKAATAADAVCWLFARLGAH